MTDTFEPDMTPPSIFNAEAAVGYFSFLPDSTEAEKQSVRFLYDCIGEEFGSKKDELNDGGITGSVTVEKIHYRYELFKQHAPFFFPQGYKPNLDPLAIAVICDEYTIHINEPLEPPPVPEVFLWHDNDNDEDLKFRDDGFGDEHMVATACYYWEEATQISGSGLPDDMPLPDAEILLLAHINMMQALREFEEKFEDYSMDDLTEMLRDELHHIQSFIMPQTAIGADLQEYADKVEARILAIVMLQPHEMPNRGLKVVSADAPALQ